MTITDRGSAAGLEFFPPMETSSGVECRSARARSRATRATARRGLGRDGRSREVGKLERTSDALLMTRSTSTSSYGALL